MFGENDGIFSFAGSGSGDGDADPDSMLETFYTPIYVLTAVFGAIFIIGPIFARKAKNKDVVITSIMIGAFSMWLFWVTVYIAQMNPLMGPRLQNTTLAWMAYAWNISPFATEKKEIQQKVKMGTKRRPDIYFR